MEAFIKVVNATGLFFLEVLEPVPVDLVMLLFVGLAAWVWFENARAFARKRRRERLSALEGVVKYD